MITKGILILSYSDLKSDPRIRRQLIAFKDKFDITTSATSDTGDNNIAFEQIYELPSFSLPRKLKRFFQLIYRKYDLYYWDNGKIKLKEKLTKKNFALIIANDIQTLPLALAIAGDSGKVYFDAHEYHPLEWEDKIKWNLLYKKYTSYLCKKYIPKADAFSTVCESIADAYKNFTGVKPFVITNATNYQDFHPKETNERKIKIIHHGAAIPSRKIELMMDVVEYLDERFIVDFMLTELDKKYLARLKKRATGNPKINFLPPVKESEICSVLHNYDIGMYILQPSNFNNRYALPNKIFEFIQARLCLAISPNPEMVKLVTTYNLGILSENFTAIAMADAIKNLTVEKINYHKQQSHIHAKDLSAESNIQKLKEVVNTLVN